MKKEEVCNRQVWIHLAMKEGPVLRAILNTLPMIGNESSHVYVDRAEAADLIIFTNMREIERGYTKEKSYAYLQTGSEPHPQLPENCVVIECSLVDLIRVINDTRRTLKPIEAPVSPQKEDVVVLDKTPLRILVIEDTLRHQASALKGLAGHMLTIVSGYEDAMLILGESMIDMQTGGNAKFDVVLTDLKMPMSSKTLGPNAFKLGELVHYGIMLMIEAAHQGVNRVAVVTDLNHHADWLSAAFDHFRYPVKIEGATALMMHAPMNADGTKDWATALDRLMKA